jgi:hypothetical protein
MNHLATRGDDMITKKVYEQSYRPKYKPSTRGEFSNARVPPTQMAVGAFTCA